MSSNKKDRGNWEFSFFQKNENLTEEAKIKKLLEPQHINFKNIDNLMNPVKSKEEIILEKKNNNLQLKYSEQIILNNYLDKEEKNYKKDIYNINKYKLSIKPITKKGKTRLLLETLKHHIQSNIDSEKNKIIIASIYLRLKEDNFILSDDIVEEYNNELTFIKNFVKSLDILKIQFNELHNHIPPLNTTDFKLDNWQKDVINNINNNLSTIINAPTSAGKSILSGYTITKGKVLFVVPTDALAWQISAYLGSIIGKNLPIITITYQSSPSRDSLIDIINKAPAIIGTSVALMDYLPFINLESISWVIFDEVHMIGSVEGKDMEHIIKLIKKFKKPFLALSATIENTDELYNWFKTVCDIELQIIKCSKRFFNLQTYYYDVENNNIVKLYPLSMIDIVDIENKSIVNKILEMTPPDIWDLGVKTFNEFKEYTHINPYEYFSEKINRITLDDADSYLQTIIKFIVEMYHSSDENKKKIIKLINKYKQINYINTDIDLYNLIFKLKQENKNPTIIFQENTDICLRYVKDLSNRLDEEELKKYPKLFKERYKKAKIIKKEDKRKTEEIKENKALKMMIGTIPSSTLSTNDEHIEHQSLQEPHIDFILNNIQYFQEHLIKEWASSLERYLPSKGIYYHYIIKLLWRGIGVYLKGLPDPYLRLVQSLAMQKQLAIVFSDKSLVFGVSMPFRTVVITNNKLNTLDGLLFKQMTGRAGRRGLDKEGNIIFTGFTIDSIKKLIISKPPKIVGMPNIIYTTDHASKLSELYNTCQDWNITCDFYFNKDTNNEDKINIIANNKLNYLTKWNFAFRKNDINHLHMIWKIRNPVYSVIASYIMQYLIKGFGNKDPSQEINQINIAHIFCYFFCIKEAISKENILKIPELLTKNPYNQIIPYLTSIGIPIITNVDKLLFNTIQLNYLDITMQDNSLQDLRNSLTELSEIIKHIQHYNFHIKSSISNILGKLLTRINFILYSSTN